MSGMDTLDRAQDFVWRTARLLERLRFAHLFRGAPAEPVIAALRAYRNPDGGFGNALEPDFRGPVSQPTTSDFALRVLDETGRPEPDLVQPLVDWLPAVTTPEGGTPLVLSTAEPYPRAPWWNPDPEQPPSLLPTAGIAGFLHRHGFAHPWLDGATAYCWAALDAVPERLEAGAWTLQIAYDVRAAVVFLDSAPDRDRAAAVSERLGHELLDRGVIGLDPADESEVMKPLDFAATPDSLPRAWFDEATVEAHLDALVSGQQADGGWTVPWDIWTPVTGPEWRGIQTVDRLKTLRAYGRI
jgi:hypothetical protein